jgi:glycosyltransferase involved in cell wall biosynthesis
MGPTVLHVTQTTHAGVRRCVLDLITDQIRRGWRVTVASPDTDGFPSRARDAGADAVVWPADRQPGVSTFREVRTLAQVVRDVEPDLVHLHSSKAGLVGRLAVRGRRPTLFQPNGWSFLAVDGPAHTAARRWERFGARWTTTLVCVSAQEQQDGAANGVTGPCRVVPNAVDLTRFSPSDRDGARLELQLPDEPLVVCVARLSRQKGQDVLLDAWPSVRAAVADARLILVGAGPDRAALEARASALEGVTFAGARTDVPRWLAAADVVALPSRWEGMSYVMLEAMACERSVVEADVGGGREALGEHPDRAAGALVPPEDPDALAAALVERLRDPALTEREGRQGVRRVRAAHDLRAWWDRMHEVAVQALGNGVAGTIAV